MEKLGKYARDKVTGFQGVIVSKVVYLYGCTQYGISPMAKDNKVEDNNYFDEGRIEILGEGVTMEDVAGDKPGGINRDCPR